jgi:hypothetical protein
LLKFFLFELKKNIKWEILPNFLSTFSLYILDNIGAKLILQKIITNMAFYILPKKSMLYLAKLFHIPYLKVGYNFNTLTASKKVRLDFD